MRLGTGNLSVCQGPAIAFKFLLVMHFNDFLLEPIKKISFKLFVAKRKKWFSGMYPVQPPGIDFNKIFKEKINGPLPVMIARYGSVELTCVLAYILSRSHKSYFEKASGFIKGEIPAFWFGHKNRTEICSNAGFFPNDKKLITRFCKKMQEDVKEVDILLSWLKGEEYILPFLPKNCTVMSLWAVEPFFQEVPWTMCLQGKKVLVIHPFAKSIARQYHNRHKIFPGKQVLPEMELKTFKAVQTIANNDAPFETWFDALDYMKQEIEKIDFDIALIGAGAYGFPLAAHIKRMGKKAVHIGGSLQLYFGIIGLRWEQIPHFKALFNEHWVRPLPEEYPQNHLKVEGGVYW